MNRTDLQQLAEDRVLDAKALLDEGRWSGAYYISGYAVECALKACIAKRTNLHDFPDKAIVRDTFTHDLLKLVDLAGLKLQLQLDVTSPPGLALGVNWQVTKKWNERARYEQRTEAQAKRLYEAVTENTNGVLQWIKIHW